MGLFRKKRPVLPDRQPRPESARPRTTFVGFAARSFERAGGGHSVPYEFWTEDGVHIYLHDMEFLGFDYRAQPPSLTMRFACDDPQWMSDETAAEPVTVLRFDGVQVWQWEDDEDLFATPEEVWGQVSHFGFYEPTNVFDLTTINTYLLFSADRLEVTREPRPAG